MKFSELNKRIEFIIIDSSTDEEGYPADVEKVIRKCWASIKGLRGKSLYEAAQVQAEKNKIVQCRYFKGLNEDMKVKYNNKIYDIKYINDINEKHIEYEIYISAVDNNV